MMIMDNLMSNLLFILERRNSLVIQSKKRYPTVIARLLGKERLPSQWRVYRQQTPSFPSYRLNIQQNFHHSDNFSNSRSSSSNQEEFKDVYVDLGESDNANRRSSSKWSANSMLTKHELALIEQNIEVSSSSGSRHITVLKPSNSMKYESTSKAWNLETDTSHLTRRDGLLLEPHIRHNAHILRDSSKTKLEEKNEEKTRPMNIVVLKPNIQKTHNGVVYDKLKKTKEDPISNEARQIARRSTSRLRNGYHDSNCSEFGGYEGDVSSYEANVSGFRRNRRSRSSSRICERWRMTQRYQDLELVANDITLGEMLATDRGRRFICISSRDGWKVEKYITSSMSRLVPPSKDKKSHRISSNNDKFAEDKYLNYSDRMRKDGFSYKDSKSRIRKPPHCRNIFINETDSHLEATFEIQMEANVKDMSELQLLRMASDDDTCKVPENDEIMIEEASDDKAAQNQRNSDLQGNYTLRNKNWEISYALDVLTASGLEERGFDMFRTDWHSPDCPLDPNLFDDLENKYEDETTTGLWSERKFLFDRINFALVEVFLEQVDLFPWVIPKFIGAPNYRREKEWVRVFLREKMNGDYAGRAISERELDQEMQWSDCRGEIEVIGNEIEKLFIDDIIAEIANSWLWEGMVKFSW